MLLTLYYMAATCIQWYRLGQMKTRLSHSLAICSSPRDLQEDASKLNGTDASNELVCSPPTISKGVILYSGIYDNSLSENQNIGELLCYQGDRRCCTVIPQKRVDLSHWVGFPKGQTFFPFEITDDILLSDNIRNINLLLHADVHKASGIDKIHTIQIEHLGVPIAWRVDSKMALIVRTDLQLFTSLCTAFMSKSIAINNSLKLLRIETVALTGKVYEYRPKDMNLSSDWMRPLSSRQWFAHVSQLRSLCSHVKHNVIKHDSNKHTSKKALHSKKTEKLKVKKEKESILIVHTEPIRIVALPPSPTSSVITSNQNYAFETEKNQNDDIPNGTIVPIVHHTETAKVEISTNADEISIEITQEEISEIKDNDKEAKSKSERYEDKLKKYLKPHKRSSKSNDSKSEKKSPDKHESKLSKNIFRSKKHSNKSDKKSERSLLSFKKHTKDNVEASDDHVKETVNIIVNPLEETTGDNLVPEEKKLAEVQSTSSASTSLTNINNECAKETKENITNENKSKINAIPSNNINLYGQDAKTKPPNVLVYADSSVVRENVTNLLNSILHKDKYTVYGLSPTSTWWGSKATLLVVCGAVSDRLGSHMLDYLLSGGRMLCLCSDFINTVLPTYTTAEVRERELVRFSYDKWQRVRMIHHIFCYQPSPGRKLFSKESSEEISPTNTRCVTPSVVEVKDSLGHFHKLEVRILGAEDTWQTPSLILASEPKSSGLAVFSQIHLELEPMQYESEENIFSALTESNSARLEILRHILEVHLGVQCSDLKEDPVYTPAYFLGSHELKLELLSRLASQMSENVLSTNKLKMQFCGKGVEPSVATSSFLPILVHSCPGKFSTVDYFDTLKTKKIGRLLLYNDVMTSSMNIFDGVTWEHGTAIVCRNQTNGTGRGGNNWLSPDGCAMFSIQLHVPLDSKLGQRISLVQILAAVVIVSSIKNLPGYNKINIGLKWPNDIYANGNIKIGGLIINSIINASTVVCNIGIGVNLNNSDPTTCINDMIKEFNQNHNEHLETFSLEKFLAIFFNEFERIYDIISEDLDYLYDTYYGYWLHNNAEVNILSPDGSSQKATVLGIDDYGYLQVRSEGKITSVHPDGNSFDMLVGLIAPKIR